MADLIPTSHPGALALDGGALLRERLESALARLAESSRRAYRDSLRAFASWFCTWITSTSPELVAVLGSPERFHPRDPFRVIGALLAAGPLVAGHVVDAFAAAEPKHRPATIALRLAAIRWAVRTARDAGGVSWTLNVRSPKVRAHRDTRGPGLPGARRMLEVAAAQEGLIGHRDSALLGLLLVLGLRRGEVAELRVEHLDLGGARLSILGKGCQDRQWLTVPPSLLARLTRYLETRGAVLPHAPLIASCDRARRGDGRMSASAIYRRVRELAHDAGVPGRVSPHRLRHTAITAALDALKGDVRRVRKFSRHAKVETLLVYDDAREDAAGEIAGVVAGVIGV